MDSEDAYSPDEEAFWACHRLASATLPPHRLCALLAHVENPAAALEISAADLRGPTLGFTERQAERLTEAARAPLPDKLRRLADSLGVRAITAHSAGYPANLVPLSDAPPLLFFRGTLRPDDRFSVAIVGSRRATAYGQKQADRFARTLAERGLTVVSGGAAGIDTYAHRGARAAGGRTLAILGCGVDVVYPADNRALFAEIAERGGALLSEFPLQTVPEPWRFPTRNRIIAGMTRGVLVIETPQDSGALITARNAAEYGRDVWVVPGPVDTGRSRGGHRLIQDGAALADGPDDVLEALGLASDIASDIASGIALASTPALQTVAHAAEDSVPDIPQAPAATTAPDLSPDERQLLETLELTPRHLDDAAAAAQLDAPQATVAATMLEMKGLIRRLPGNLYTRAL